MASQSSEKIPSFLQQTSLNGTFSAMVNRTASSKRAVVCSQGHSDRVIFHFQSQFFPKLITSVFEAPQHKLIHHILLLFLFRCHLVMHPSSTDS